MSRRRINPDTGEPELTYREQMFINEYIQNGGNGKQAAIDAGYGAARADQSAYQVLHRLRVQQHIRDRLSESIVSADEIIGTLVSFMRGNIAELLDDNGDFDINVVRERRLGHLLKTITRTTRKLKAEPGQPPEFAQDYRIQLHSPVQAASILARLKGLSRKTSDLQSDHLAAEEASPETEVGTSPDTERPQVGGLPHITASPPLGHTSAPLVPNSGFESSSNLSSIGTPAPQPADLPSAASQPSPGGPQRSPLQKLRRIGRRIMNLQKINATQCLEGNSTQPPPLRQDRRCPQTTACTVESSNTQPDDARRRRVLR